MAEVPDWAKPSINAASAGAAPVADKSNAQVGSLQAGAASSAASAAETTATLPAKVRKGAAEATLAEIKAGAAVSAKDKQEQNQRLAGLRKAGDTANILTNIQQARDNIGLLSTGVPGQILQNVWGTDAKDLHASLSSIMGPGVLEKLGEMKAQSATGASGFGALSEKELQLIKDSLGAIGQDQSSEQLLSNLNRLEEHYRRFQAYNAGLDPDEPEVAHATGLMPSAQADDEAGKVTNEGKFEYNPKRAGMNSTIMAMIKAGRTADEIRAWADTVEPGLGARINNVEQGIADWKKTKRPQDVDVEREFIPQNDPAAKAVGAALNNPVGAFGAGSVDAYTSGFADEGLGATGAGSQAGNEALFRGMSEEHPVAFNLGNMVGSLAQYATGAKLLGPLASRYGLSPAVSELFQNASYGAGSSQPGDRMVGAATGATTGFLGDKVIRGAGKGVSRFIGGITDDGVRLLRERGVPTTIGQTLGGSIKELEDKATSWPIVGPTITKRRREAYEGFNRAAFDEALAPIGGGTKNLGEAGIADAQDQVGAAYSRALDGVDLAVDPAFDAARINGVQSLAAIPNVGPELQTTVDRIFTDAIDPTTGSISGARYQVMMQELRDLRKGYSKERQFSLDIKPVLDNIEEGAEGLFERQHPERLADFQAANTANRHVSILGETVNNAPAATDGIFTPAQLRAKSKQNTALYASKRQSARGNRPFFELDKAGRKNLPSNYPDSGTAGRMLLPATLGILAGGGTLGAEAADSEPGVNLTGPIVNTGLAMLAGGVPYSRASQSLVRGLVSGNRSPLAQQVGELGSRYLAPAAATAFRPFTSGALIDRTPNPDVPYDPGRMPAGAPPLPDVPAAPELPEGASVDPETGEIVLADGTRLPLEPKAFAYGGAVRRLAHRYNCGGRVA